MKLSVLIQNIQSTSQGPISSKRLRRIFVQVGLKSLLRQGLSEPDFYGDLVYKLKKIVGSNNFQRSSLK